MGILFNSVTQFVLQPELTKRWVKRDDLDTLSEVYIGPAGGEDAFTPSNGSQHGQYSLMRLISSESKRLPAAVVQVTLNYQGKLANGASYTSVPTVNKYWMDGEVSYQVNGSFGQSYPITYGTGQVSWVSNTQVGILTYVRRYTGRCVELTYITNNVPTGEPTGVGLAPGFMGFQNVWDVMSGFNPGMQLSGGGNPIYQMACTDVRVEDRADGWYRVTETYQSKMFPGETGYQYTPPTLQAGSGSRLIDSNTTQPKPGGTGGTTNPDNQPPDYSAYDFTLGLGNNPSDLAQYMASRAGSTLAVSGSGSIGASTYGSTGMDPSWGQTTNYNDGEGGNAGDMYPMISNDSATPGNVDVGTSSQVYSG